LRHSGNGTRRQRSVSSTAGTTIQKEQDIVPKFSSKNEEKDTSRISTREIPWRDIAGIFQKVQLPDAIMEQKEREVKLSAKERTIFAPIVRKLDSIPVVEKYDEESDDEEEDVTDENILSRHRAVLDRMKARLSFVE
jgi:hypothetical protein